MRFLDWLRGPHSTSDPRWRPEYSELARYNAERSRGVVHTPETDARMADLQERYNEVYFTKTAAVKSDD